MTIVISGNLIPLHIITQFPAMIWTHLVTELLRCQHIQTINMEIAVSFNEMDF